MSSKTKNFRVKQVSDLAHVSVRTLHHYDAIGLLVPSGRSIKGYRLYTWADLLRLRQIALHRKLGLSLAEIQRLLDDPKVDRKAALDEHRARLLAERGRIDDRIASVDRALTELNQDMNKEPKTMQHASQLFEGFDPSLYEEESTQRWGSTEPYRIAQERTSAYGSEQWKELKQESDAIFADIAQAISQGTDAKSPEALQLAERHRLHIDRWFYPCSVAMHVSLADLYEQDERFRQNMDKHGDGVTDFLVAAIRNCGAR